MIPSENIEPVRREPIVEAINDATLGVLVCDRATITGREFEDHELEHVEIAFNLAMKENARKKRKDGTTPAFVHPWNVTRILARHGADYITLCSAFLHDLVEDAVDSFVDEYRLRYGKVPDDAELTARETYLIDRLTRKLVTEFRKQTCVPCLKKMGLDRGTITNVFRDITRYIKSSGAFASPDDKGKVHHPTDGGFGWSVRELVRRIRHLEPEAFRYEVDEADYQWRERFARRAAADLTGRLIAKYGLQAKHHHLLTVLNNMHFNIRRIISIVDALTRKKGKYYPESINHLFDHTHDVRLKIRTIMVKLSDRNHNIQDLNPRVFHPLQRLNQSFKNVYLLNRTVEFLLEWRRLLENDSLLGNYYRQVVRLYEDCGYHTWAELDQLVEDTGSFLDKRSNRRLRADLQRYEYELCGLGRRTGEMQLNNRHFDNISNEFLEYMYTPRGENRLTDLAQTWYGPDGSPRSDPDYDRLFIYSLALRAVATNLRWGWRRGFFIRDLTNLAVDNRQMARKRETAVEG